MITEPRGPNWPVIFGYGAALLIGVAFWTGAYFLLRFLFF